MFITREYDLREVRRLLGDPKNERPTLDIIVSNMIAAEQYMLNRQMGVSKNWTHRQVASTTVPAMSIYTLSPVGAETTFGKAIYVYLDTDGNSKLRMIPFIDFTADPNNNRYEFWVAHPPQMPEAAIFTDAGSVKIHLAPTPTVAQSLVVAYATGVLDFRQFELGESANLPEFARYRQLDAALATLMHCEWDGFSLEMNVNKRRELGEYLTREYVKHEVVFTQFLQSNQAALGSNEAARRLGQNLG